MWKRELDAPMHFYEETFLETQRPRWTFIKLNRDEVPAFVLMLKFWQLARCKYDCNMAGPNEGSLYIVLQDQMLTKICTKCVRLSIVFLFCSIRQIITEYLTFRNLTQPGKNYNQHDVHFKCTLCNPIYRVDNMEIYTVHRTTHSMCTDHNSV